MLRCMIAFIVGVDAPLHDINGHLSAEAIPDSALRQAILKCVVSNYLFAIVRCDRSVIGRKARRRMVATGRCEASSLH